ncbi:MAG: serine hydrolase domain-containing protein [Granulosicoccus sp.]
MTNNDITEKSSAVISDFTNFLNEQELSAGAIAVAYEGELVDSAGVNRQATDIAPVASLSKAITAVCTIKALELGNFQTSAKLGEVMPATLAGLETSDDRLRDITVLQLLTHNSGIHTAHVSVLGTTIPTMRLEQKNWQLEFIARDGLAADPGSGYVYANANYLILGIIIEAIVQDDYENWCQQQVLQPLGITSARLSPTWTLLSAFGGWEISATDYLTFVNAYYKPDNIIGQDPDTTTLFTTVNGNVRYSLGTLMLLSPSGAVFWHAGSFTWQSSEQSGRFGAYFAVYPNGYSVSVNLSDDLNDSRASELDSLLFQLAQ